MRAFIVGMVLLMGVGAAVSASQTPTKNVWDGIFTADQAKRGTPVYMEKCARCHADALTGKDAPPLKGPEFNANWNGLSVNDLFERIRISMPDDAKGTLTRPEVADLVAVILQANEMPAGQTEVPTTADALGAINYLGSKP